MRVGVRNLIKALGATLWTIIRVFGLASAMGVIMGVKIQETPWVGAAIVLIWMVIILLVDNMLRLEEKQKDAANFELAMACLRLSQAAGGSKLQGEIQKMVDVNLMRESEKTQQASKRLIQLQKEGIEAWAKKNDITLIKDAEEEELEDLRQIAHRELKTDFANGQDGFYLLWDYYRRCSGTCHIKLRERSWKAYLDEEQVKETT